MWCLKLPSNFAFNGSFTFQFLFTIIIRCFEVLSIFDFNRCSHFHLLISFIFIFQRSFEFATPKTPFIFNFQMSHTVRFKKILLISCFKVSLNFDVQPLQFEFNMPFQFRFSNVLQLSMFKCPLNLPTTPGSACQSLWFILLLPIPDSHILSQLPDNPNSACLRLPDSQILRFSRFSERLIEPDYLYRGQVARSIFG